MNPLILENHWFEAQLVQYGKYTDRYNLAFFKKYVLKICRKIRKWKNNSTCIIILYLKISQQKYEKYLLYAFFGAKYNNPTNYNHIDNPLNKENYFHNHIEISQQFNTLQGMCKYIV